MRFLIEFDGPLADIAAAHFQTYHEVAGEIGWSRVDQASYWRLVRTKGRQAPILPGAGPIKIAQFQAKFEERVESADAASRYVPRPKIDEVLRTLARHGSCQGITLGTNADARRALLDRGGSSRLIAGPAALSTDPRRRPAELRKLAQGDPRTMVVGASDVILRAAREAELLAVGVSSGPCTPARLHQAGADVVYAELSELAASLSTGAKDLIQAGLLPKSLE